MRHHLGSLFCVLFLLGPISNSRGQSTIDGTSAYGWSANAGWTNWRPSAGQGASIGEYICQGYVYSANVGWINLGNGAPANQIQYQNNSASDWGVNYFPTATPGVAILRGYAYAANIGWIAFEGVGNPSVNLANGQLYGYAYSANCGWVNLGTNTVFVVKTDSIAPGIDTDGDGIADAWELIYFGDLTRATATSDYSGDGVTDLEKYLEGANPLLPSSTLRITNVVKASVSPVTLDLTFTSTAARLYRVETSTTLINPLWTDAGLGILLPDTGTSTTRPVTAAGSTQFFRVNAFRLGF